MPVITSLDTTFTDLLDGIEAASAAAAGASFLTGQRQWFTPPLNGWSGNPTEIQDIALAFDRSNIGSDYTDVMGDPSLGGTVGEAMVLKLQSDYISSMERAFRSRHASSVRCRLHAAGRYKGHGQANGPFSGSVEVWLTRMLNAAHDDPW